MGYIECSAKQDIGISQAFKTLVSKIYEQVSKTHGLPPAMTEQEKLQAQKRDNAFSLHEPKPQNTDNAGGKKKGCC